MWPKSALRLSIGHRKHHRPRFGVKRLIANKSERIQGQWRAFKTGLVQKPKDSHKEEKESLYNDESTIQLPFFLSTNGPIAGHRCISALCGGNQIPRF